MACETRRTKPQQTAQERRDEVRRAVGGLDKAISMGGVKVVVGPQGAVTFAGWTNGRDDVTDACAYRLLMVQGSALTKVAIQRAAQMAGRSINMQAVGAGVHSHDGGKTWDKH